jgi:hypothetical protein
MEDFFKDHWQLVSTLVGALLVIIGFLLKIVWSIYSLSNTNSYKNLEERVKELEVGRGLVAKDLGIIHRQNADSARDREGIHEALNNLRDTILDRMKIMTESNDRDHDRIMQLIKRNGSSHGK